MLLVSLSLPFSGVDSLLNKFSAQKIKDIAVMTVLTSMRNLFSNRMTTMLGSAGVKGHPISRINNQVNPAMNDLKRCKVEKCGHDCILTKLIVVARRKLSTELEL